MRGFGVITLFMIVGAVQAWSQELVTDRPDFTESAVVVPKQSVQFEIGGAVERVEGDSEWLYPNTLVRIGLFERAEVRLGVPGWSTQKVATQYSTLFKDVYVESKIQLTRSDARVPMALILAVTVPSGNRQVSSGKSDVGLKYALAYDVSERIGCGANIGIYSIGTSDSRHLSALTSISCGISVSDNVGIFLETFAEMPENEVWLPTLDTGCTFLLAPLFQLDAFFGLGLNSAAVDEFAGLGLSVRL